MGRITRPSSALLSFREVDPKVTGEMLNESLDVPSKAWDATWWLEAFDPWSFGWRWEGPWPIQATNDRIRNGPPKT